MMRLTVSLVVLMASTSAQALAGPIVVDQSNFCLCSNMGQGVFNDDTFPFLDREVAQTFTIQNSGTLRAVAFLGNSAGGTLKAFVVPVVGGVPTQDLSLALGSASAYVMSASVNLITFSGLEVPVSSGDVLAVVLAGDLKPAGTTAFNISGTSPPFFDYASGSFFARFAMGLPNDTAPWVQGSEGADLSFRTYVECADVSVCVEATDPQPPPGTVPEPSVMSLLALAASAVHLRRYSSAQPR